MINSTLKLWLLGRYQGCRDCSWALSTFLNLHKLCRLLLEGEKPCLHMHALQDCPIRSVSFSFEERIHDLWIGRMFFRSFIN